MFDEEEEYNEYISDLTKYISKDKDDFVSLNNRGVAYFELGNLEAALSDLTVACRFADCIAPFLNRAYVLRKMSDLEGALDAVNKALIIDPQKSCAYFVRSKIYEALGDTVRAEQDKQTGNRYRSS